MIGNDVVDLVTAAKESNWHRKGFLKKIFTEKEQFYISNSDDPNLIVWLLWSMKESSYKIFVQKYLKRFFSPLKFECNLIINLKEIYTAEVSIENIKCVTTSKISRDSIFTIALLNDKESNQVIAHKNFKFQNSSYKKQQQQIYSALLENISKRINKNSANLSIKKDGYGIPRLFEKGSELIYASVSISHHGLYGAYAIDFVN